jgi:hypothetical protein
VRQQRIEHKDVTGLHGNGKSWAFKHVLIAELPITLLKMRGRSAEVPTVVNHHAPVVRGGRAQGDPNADHFLREGRSRLVEGKQLRANIG